MSNRFIKLADGFFVSPQITPAEVSQAKSDGITLIINNRPDGEEAGQPDGDTIAEAAREAGIDYVAIPVGPMGINETMLQQFADAIAGNDGAVLAYCRTGTRSTMIRALSEARGGRDIDAIIAEAHAAGYDLSGRRDMLRSMTD